MTSQSVIAAALGTSMAPTPMHLHLVEDDPDMRQMVREYLSQHGFQVTAMASAEEFLARIHRARPHLAIVDVSLPGLSGLQACQKLRADGDRLPVILLTALTEEIDRVIGLEMGADDYLGKPFSPRELLARVRALLRRAGAPAGVPAANLEAVVVGSVTVHLAERHLTMADGRNVALATVEYAMLAELLTHPNVALSRERLLAVSHGNVRHLLPRTVDVSIMRLRKLLEPDVSNPRYLQTVRNHGYVYVP